MLVLRAQEIDYRFTFNWILPKICLFSRMSFLVKKFFLRGIWPKSVSFFVIWSEFFPDLQFNIFHKINVFVKLLWSYTTVLLLKLQNKKKVTFQNQEADEFHTPEQSDNEKPKQTEKNRSFQTQNILSFHVIFEFTKYENRA